MFFVGYFRTSRSFCRFRILRHVLDHFMVVVGICVSCLSESAFNGALRLGGVWFSICLLAGGLIFLHTLLGDISCSNINIRRD